MLGQAVISASPRYQLLQPAYMCKNLLVVARNDLLDFEYLAMFKLRKPYLYG